MWIPLVYLQFQYCFHKSAPNQKKHSYISAESLEWSYHMWTTSKLQILPSPKHKSALKACCSGFSRLKTLLPGCWSISTYYRKSNNNMPEWPVTKDWAWLTLTPSFFTWATCQVCPVVDKRQKIRFSLRTPASLPIFAEPYKLSVDSGISNDSRLSEQAPVHLPRETLVIHQPHYCWKYSLLYPAQRSLPFILQQSCVNFAVAPVNIGSTVSITDWRSNTFDELWDGRENTLQCVIIANRNQCFLWSHCPNKGHHYF